MSVAESEIEEFEEDNIEDMYLIFGIVNENYAVGIMYVTEVISLQKILEVPDVPDYIKGVINLRGNVIPIMDLRQRFGLEALEYSDRTVIIVLETNDIKTGLVVDCVKDVLEIDPKEIDPPPNRNDVDDQQVVLGMGKHGDSISIMLDVKKLLFSKDVALLDEA